MPTGVYTNNGGVATFTGGSVTTNGKIAVAVASTIGSSVTLNGGIAILTTGDGSAALVLTGGGSLTATNVSVTTHGNLDPAFGYVSNGAYNGNNGPGAPTGGAMTF